jgi:hypothetical protein
LLALEGVYGIYSVVFPGVVTTYGEGFTGVRIYLPAPEDFDID